MKAEEDNLGTIRKRRDVDGKVTFQALLPRRLSSAPPRTRHPERYQESLGSHATREQARAVLDAALLDLSSKDTLRAGLPLSWFVEAAITTQYQAARRKYGDDARAAQDVSTWRSIQKRWFRKAPFMDWQPSKVLRRDLQAFVGKLNEANNVHGEPLSPMFVRNVVNLLRKAFDRAGVDDNPARGLKLPKKPKPKVPYLDLARQRALFASEAVELEDRLMIGCGMGAGVRVGELLAVEKVDVHVDDADPHVWVRYGGDKRAPPKGEEVRRVELYEPGLGFWRLWMAEHCDPDPKVTRVFGGPLGGYRKAWPEQFQKWAQAAGVKSLTSHIMRHTFAVSLLSGTWGYDPKSLEFVSKQLGHADIQTTQRYYASFEAGTWQREVRRMTGRADVGGEREVVTAASLLGLEAREAGVRPGVKNHPISSVGNGQIDVVPRHPPEPQKTRRKWHKNPQLEARRPQVDSGPVLTRAAGLATELLALSTSGDGRVFEVARALAAEVLGSQAVALATEIQAGGPHALTRALALAELVIRSADLGAVLDDVVGGADG